MLKSIDLKERDYFGKNIFRDYKGVAISATHDVSVEWFKIYAPELYEEARTVFSKPKPKL